MPDTHLGYEGPYFDYKPDDAFSEGVYYGFDLVKDKAHAYLESSISAAA